MLSLPEMLYIIDQDAWREMWFLIGNVAIALFTVVIIYTFVRPAVAKLFREIRRMRKLEVLFLAWLASPFIVYGATKIMGVFGFAAKECPDSVTFTWDEATSGVTVNRVQVERRIKGATEEEAWERWGSPVSGGQKHITIDGFTLDKDYEYRAKYVYTEDAQ